MIRKIFMKDKILNFFLIGILISSTGFYLQKGKEMLSGKMGDLEILENNIIKLGILAKAGGRIVLLQRENGRNILKTDSSYWNYKYEDPLEKRLYMNKLPFNGHIVWLGPQSEWWSRQDKNLELKNKQSRWPPDPYLTYSDYEIVEKTKNRITLDGPASEYTGVKLSKTIELLDNGKISFTVTCENIRKQNVSWDLWMNTRVDGNNKVYVPVANQKDLNMEYRLEKGMEKMPYKIINGFFTFETKRPEKGIKKAHGKSFIYPCMDRIFSFTKNEMFVIQFKRYEKKLVHPEQGLIEIYNSVDDKDDALMELEYHTPYIELKPGEKMTGKEIWEVIKYNGGESSEEHILFIEKYFTNKMN